MSQPSVAVALRRNATTNQITTEEQLMETEEGFEGINPVRWPEVRRRVAAVRAYIALDKPNAADRDRLAQEIGVSRSTFLNLVRSWRQYGSPAKLAGAGRSQEGRKSSNGLPIATITEVESTIAEIGAASSTAAIIKKVRERLRGRRLTQPSDSTITNMIMKARAEGRQPVDIEPQLLIEECVVALPTVWPPGLVLPRAVIAVLVPERVVIAADFEPDPRQPLSVERLVARLGSLLVDERSRPIFVGRSLSSLSAATRKPTNKRQASLSRVFGQQLGGIRLIYRPSVARSAERALRSRHDCGLEPDEARKAFEHALAVNNWGRGVKKVPPASNAAGYLASQ